MQCNNRRKAKTWRAQLVLRIGFKVGQWSFLRELRPHLSVGGVHNMTVSLPWRLASISGAAGGEFDDGCVVDRWDGRAIGRSPHGRSWHLDGPEFRQYPDFVGYGRGLHWGDHAQPLGGCSGTEENSIAAWPCCSGGNQGSPKRLARSGLGKRRFLIQPRPAVRGRSRPCRVAGAVHLTMAGGGRGTRSRAVRAGAGGGRASGQAAAQSAVFLIIAERARACSRANERSSRG